MSKTYILEPVELEFDGSRSANLDSFIPEETLAKIDRQYVFELSDGTILKFWEYYSISTEYYFTINGDPIDWDYYDQHQEETMPVYAVISDRPSLPGGPIDTTKIFCPLPGTYTVSIYTETEDEDAKPYIDEKLSKNVTYTDHPHNNWEEVLSKKGDPKTGYNTIEKIANASSSGGSSSGGAGYSVQTQTVVLAEGTATSQVWSDEYNHNSWIEIQEDDLVYVKFETLPDQLTCVWDGATYILPKIENQESSYGNMDEWSEERGTYLINDLPVRVNLWDYDNGYAVARIDIYYDDAETEHSFKITADVTSLVVDDQFKEAVSKSIHTAPTYIELSNDVFNGSLSDEEITEISAAIDEYAKTGSLPVLSISVSSGMVPYKELFAYVGYGRDADGAYSSRYHFFSDGQYIIKWYNGGDTLIKNRVSIDDATIYKTTFNGIKATRYKNMVTLSGSPGTSTYDTGSAITIPAGYRPLSDIGNLYAPVITKNSNNTSYPTYMTVGYVTVENYQITPRFDRSVGSFEDLVFTITYPTADVPRN